MIASYGAAQYQLGPSTEGSPKINVTAEMKSPAKEQRTAQMKASVKSGSLDNFPLNIGDSERSSVHKDYRHFSGDTRRTTLQTQLTKEDQEALKEYRRGKLCCCDKEGFVHKFTLLMIVVDIAMLGLISTMYFQLMFWDPEDINAFMWLYKEGAVT